MFAGQHNVPEALYMRGDEFLGHATYSSGAVVHRTWSWYASSWEDSTSRSWKEFSAFEEWLRGKYGDVIKPFVGAEYFEDQSECIDRGYTED